MKLKQLEHDLSSLHSFKDPKYELEQYPTSAHIAARMIFAANAEFDDVDGRMTLDLGCGTGMLAFAAELAGSCYTVGIDIDPDALQVATSNSDSLDSEVEFIQADVLDQSKSLFPDKFFDTVFMNPPFGTRRKGADVGFLEAGLRLARCSVYSMHKTSTREFLRRKAQKEWGVQFQVVAELRFDIKKMYKFHKKQSADIHVDVIRLSFPSESRE